MVFSFVQIKNSTKKFSEKLGEGGFGCVFKGMLPSCTVVAIKKLKGLGQEDKQFRAEVQTIGMIQHINIVHLLGFCAEDLIEGGLTHLQYADDTILPLDLDDESICNTKFLLFCFEAMSV
jgi:serine/threonine protein kinase